MSNEMKIKNGLIVQGQITATGITSSLLGTASWASNTLTASYALGTNVVGTVGLATSASFASSSLSASYVLASNVSGTVTSASFATSASTNLLTAASVNNNYTLGLFASASATYQSNLYDTNNKLTYNPSTQVLTSVNVSASSFQGSVTGSVLGTASWASNALSAVTASFALNFNPSATASYATLAATSSLSTTASFASFAALATTASFASTSSFLNGFPFDNVTTGSLISQSIFSVLQRTTGSFIAAYFDYAAVSASNIRSGTVFGSWVNGQITFAEYTNTDVGNTNDVTMSAGISGSNVQLSASTWTSINWTIRSLARYI